MFTLDKKKLVNEKHEFGYRSQASGMDNLHCGCFAGVFYFVFQIIGYNSFLLSVTLIASVLVDLTVLFVWRILKKAIRN